MQLSHFRPHAAGPFRRRWRREEGSLHPAVTEEHSCHDRLRNREMRLVTEEDFAVQTNLLALAPVDPSAGFHLKMISDLRSVFRRQAAVAPQKTRQQWQPCLESN